MSGFETERAACGQLGERKNAARWLDGFALCASSLCTLHCLGLPLLFALLPAFASRIDPGESFHVIMLALAIPTSLFALIRGRQRGGMAPLMTGMAGLALMAVGALAASSVLAETLWTVSGSLLLAGAHILNWRRGLSEGHDAPQ